MAEAICKRCIHHDICDSYSGEEIITFFPYNEDCEYFDDVKNYSKPVHAEWETVHGVLTPGGDPLKRCPVCKSRESEHLDGVEHPSRWQYCPICGTVMDGKGD